MNIIMEAMSVLAEIESLKNPKRDPRAFSLDPLRSKPGTVKVRELFKKHKFITGKNLTPKQKKKNLMTMHGLHRDAADAFRLKASDTEKTMPKVKPGRGSGDLDFYQKKVAFHTDKADKLKDKLSKAL